MKSQREVTAKNIMLDKAQAAANPETKLVETSAEITGFVELVVQTGGTETPTVRRQIMP